MLGEIQERRQINGVDDSKKNQFNRLRQCHTITSSITYLKGKYKGRNLKVDRDKITLKYHRFDELR